MIMNGDQQRLIFNHYLTAKTEVYTNSNTTQKACEHYKVAVFNILQWYLITF